MKKTDYFKWEISDVKNPLIRKFLIGAIKDIPEYFFEVPASSSGRFHPKYALGEGGLLRHTKAAVMMAEHLLRLEKYSGFTNDEKDLIRCALILHDSRKSGTNAEATVTAQDDSTKITYTSKTKPHHPRYAANAIYSNKENIKNLTPEQLKFLLTGITSHMGQWNLDWATNKQILPKPNTLHRELIHLCDYLASRKNFTAEIATHEQARQEELDSQESVNR